MQIKHFCKFTKIISKIQQQIEQVHERTKKRQK